MTSTSTDSKGTALPAGVIFDIGTNSYWACGVFKLTRTGNRRGTWWELTDFETFDTRRFKTESAGLAALAALA